MKPINVQIKLTGGFGSKKSRMLQPRCWFGILANFGSLFLRVAATHSTSTKINQPSPSFSLRVSDLQTFLLLLVLTGGKSLYGSCGGIKPKLETYMCLV